MAQVDVVGLRFGFPSVLPDLLAAGVDFSAFAEYGVLQGSTRDSADLSPELLMVGYKVDDDTRLSPDLGRRLARSYSSETS